MIPLKEETNTKKFSPVTVDARDESGQIIFSAELQSASIRLSDELTLTMTVRKPIGVPTEFPRIESSISSLVVVQSRDLLPRLEGNSEILQRVYRLAPQNVGQQQLLLPPLWINPLTSDLGTSDLGTSDLKTGQIPQSQSQESNSGGLTNPRSFIELPVLQFEVTSQLSTSTVTLDDLRSPIERLEPSDRQLNMTSLGLIALLLGLFCAVGLGVVVYRRRKLRRQNDCTPKQKALTELQQLIDAELWRRDSKSHYVELSSIVRKYFESAVGIHAPEQTTEEFLKEIQSSQIFPADLKQQLARFLELSDLVKFAGVKPQRDEILASQQAAEAVICAQLRCESVAVELLELNAAAKSSFETAVGLESNVQLKSANSQAARSSR